MNIRRWWVFWVVTGLVASGVYSEASVGGKGKTMEPRSAKLTLRVVERGQTEPLPARIKIRDREGFLYRPKDTPAYRMSFVCQGEISLNLPVGHYTAEVSRGPEYTVAEKGFSLNSEKTLTIELSRWIHMAERGWWSGEFHIHRPLEQLDDLMLAEDLNVGVVQTIWNDRDEWRGGPPSGPAVRKADPTHVYDVLCTEDERGAGAVLLFNLKEPLRLPPHTRWVPTNIGLCRRAMEMGGWVDVEKPFWWGSPVIVALGLADSVGIANNHLTEIAVYDYPAWGRARDSNYADGPRGFWEYVCGIWYHLLNCGYRLPASAGSASGVLPNPVGFNRCYVHLDGAFSYERWLEALKAGRNFVTNGPMLFFKVAGKEPGETVPLPLGQTVAVSVEIQSIKPVSDVEIIAGGKRMAVYTPQRKGRHIQFTISVDPGEASWIAARCFGYEQEILPCAHTSPVYLEDKGRKTVEPSSARYFVQWMDQFISMLENQKDAFASEKEKKEVLDTYCKAQKVYEELAKINPKE